MSDLIHCITNPISMMQCANAVLALGAKPIMAEHPLEVYEITETASALLINTGNIADTRMEAMKISYDAALMGHLPIVIDAVGTACSKLRREFVSELLEKTNNRQNQFLLLKGNYSEIKALADAAYRGKGVDAEESLDENDIIDASGMLSQKYGVVVLATGAKDIITGKEGTFFVSNGHPAMSSITGTGCMLGAICATYLSREKSINSVVKACSFFGIAGEVAYEKLVAKKHFSEVNDGIVVGCGSFLVGLLDALSLVDLETVRRRERIEQFS